MKTIHIILILIVVVAIAVVVSTLTDSNTYADFSQAAKNPDREYHVIGQLNRQKAIDYEPPAGGVFPYRSPGHEQNFIECVRTRKEPVMPIEAGHATAALCILGNISYILGRRLRWDWRNERVIGDAEANRMLSRPNRSPWSI